MATHTHTAVAPAARPPKARATSLHRKTESALLITRSYSTSQRRVFRAFTVPALLMRWWAPKGWSTPYVSVDCRKGGLFHYCMRSPEGKDIWGRGVFREIDAPKRIVYSDSFADEEGNPVDPSHYGMSAEYPMTTQVTISLARFKGGTKLTLRHDVPRTFLESEMMQQGWNEMLDRLGTLLAETSMEVSKVDNETIFTRSFAVPRDRLFNAWLDQELLAEWWGPHDFTNPACITNPKQGGGYRIVMRSPEGIDQSVSGEYLEICTPECLTFTNMIDDAPAEFLEQLNKYHHGARYTSFPTLTLSLQFEEQAEKTCLTLRTCFASNGERDAFIKLGYPEGMAESLEKLEELFSSCSMSG